MSTSIHEATPAAPPAPPEIDGLDDIEGMALISAIRNAHGFVGDLYGIGDVLAQAENEDELLEKYTLEELGDALAGTDAWEELDEALQNIEGIDGYMERALAQALESLERRKA